MPTPSPLSTLTGWGRTAPTAARLRRVASADEAVAVLRDAGPRGVLARGLGRSYGDAAQNAGGTVLDTTALADIRTLDTRTGEVECDAGVSLGRLARLLLPSGWFLPVSPGTLDVTVGGAIAADVHGKNHPSRGSFGRHVLSMELLTADCRIRTLTPAGEPELFRATTGGMGLTGVILSARLVCLPVGTAWMHVTTERAADLDDAMARMADDDPRTPYAAAWIDMLARGGSTGRAVVTRGGHARSHRPAPADLATSRAPHVLRGLPPVPPGLFRGLLNRPALRVYNDARYRRTAREPREHLRPLVPFLHPLDRLPGWNRLYGRSGLVQYQCAVPFGAEATLRRITGVLAAHDSPVFLAVLKRLGPAGRGWLSFPLPGWTLALDLPASAPDLDVLLDRFDDLVLEAGGRVYLAKDSRLRPEHLNAMYPRVDEFRELRARIDPTGTFTSDLARRLRL